MGFSDPDAFDSADEDECDDCLATTATEDNDRCRMPAGYCRRCCVDDVDECDEGEMCESTGNELADGDNDLRNHDGFPAHLRLASEMKRPAEGAVRRSSMSSDYPWWFPSPPDDEDSNRERAVTEGRRHRQEPPSASSSRLPSSSSSCVPCRRPGDEWRSTRRRPDLLPSWPTVDSRRRSPHPSSGPSLAAVILSSVMVISLTSTAVSASLPCPKEGCLCVPRQVTCSGAGLTELPKNLLFDDVETLSLVRNKLKKIPPNYFKNFKRLRRLYLDKNFITEVAPHFLEGLPSAMETISLEENRIKTLNPFSFGGIRGAGDILLGRNELRVIREFAFAGTANVNMLILSGNPLKRLEAFAFSGLTDINFLELPKGITYIHSDAFHGLNHVGFMTLSGLNLTELRGNTFRELHNVSVFTMADSHLDSVARGAFAGMNNIQNLDVLNNTFSSFDELRIDAVNEVRALKIEGNTFLNIGIPGRFLVSASRSVSVKDNSFPCDCRIHRVLRDGVSVVGFAETNYCNSPPDVAGLTIQDALNRASSETDELCPGDDWNVFDEWDRSSLSTSPGPGPTSSSSQLKAASSHASSPGSESVSTKILLLAFLPFLIFVN